MKAVNMKAVNGLDYLNVFDVLIQVN